MVDRRTLTRLTPMRASTPRWNRFYGISRFAALAWLAVLAVLLAYSVSLTLNAQHPTKLAGEPNTVVKGYTDHDLYRDIIKRVERGQGYYQSAAIEQRAHRYPMHPFVAVRPPTLAWVGSTLGITGLKNAMIALAVLAVVLWGWRLGRDPQLPWWYAVGALGVLGNVTQTIYPEWAVIHEVSAGLLIAIALALYRRDAQWPTFIIMVIAVSIRETALPVAALLGLFSLIDRNWRMVVAWLALAFVFAVSMGFHAQHVVAVARATDLNSAGWTGLGGWSSYLKFVAQSSGLRYFPAWATGAIVPFALFGWLSWRSRMGTIMLIVHLGYAMLLMLAARKDNFYWAMILVPTLFVGLVFVPSALWSAFRSLISGPAARADRYR